MVCDLAHWVVVALKLTLGRSVTSWPHQAGPGPGSPRLQYTYCEHSLHWPRGCTPRWKLFLPDLLASFCLLYPDTVTVSSIRGLERWGSCLHSEAEPSLAFTRPAVCIHSCLPGLLPSATVFQHAVWVAPLGTDYPSIKGGLATLMLHVMELPVETLPWLSLFF